MRPKLKFRPSLADTKRANDKAQLYYSAMAGIDPPPGIMNNVPPKRERGPRVAKTTQTEAEVQKEIIHFLCRNPRVELVIRCNSGAVGYVKFNQLYLPVRYRAQLPDVTPKVLIPDVIALLTNGTLAAFEVKEEKWTRSFGDGDKATREAGQARFLAHVQRAGGIGIFATCIQDVETAL